MSFKIVKIGRAKDNDIVLTHPSVSRYHCEFFYDGEGNVFLTDKASSNGTFVNGRRINGSVKLEVNDIVKPGLDLPLRWRNFETYSAGSSIEPNKSDFNNKQINVEQPVYHPRAKKMNGGLKTVLITLSIVLLIAVVWFLLSEFVFGVKKPAIVDPDKPNDRTEQPEELNKEKTIIYDFDCLKDENDLGTTGLIDELEKLDQEITDASGAEVTIQEEIEAGDLLLKECRDQYAFIESGSKIANLRAILGHLTAQIKEPKGYSYEIFLIESDELNAFTAGAKIFMTTTMYNFCQTNDELACIIGHEINHNELGHIKDQLKKQKMLTPEGAAILQLATISFGQKKETHCDMTGIDLVIAAGYNGCVNIPLWRRMQQESNEGEYNAFENLFRSHPYSEKRADCSHEHILRNYDFDCNSVN
jgi:hypothetical protein